MGDCWFDPNRAGGGGDAGAGEGGDGGGDGGGEPASPLVLRESVGPYDAAVLDASSKEAMLQWLEENGFFVPAGTDEAVEPYIREGGYFLALKLLKGQDAGDIQPVVVDYESDYPMIPIVLTGVAADPDMPVMVWVLGESRAIPRNYFHTEINDAEIDWLNFGQNYVEVINKAVDEAERAPLVRDRVRRHQLDHGRPARLPGAVRRHQRAALHRRSDRVRRVPELQRLRELAALHRRDLRRPGARLSAGAAAGPGPAARGADRAAAGAERLLLQHAVLRGGRPEVSPGALRGPGSGVRSGRADRAARRARRPADPGRRRAVPRQPRT